jgi:hypothetical protein
MTRAPRTADIYREWISDVVVFEPPYRPITEGLRIHFVSSGWSVLHGMIELRRLLRDIDIELIDETGLDRPRHESQLTAGNEEI